MKTRSPLPRIQSQPQTKVLNSEREFVIFSGVLKKNAIISRAKKKLDSAHSRSLKYQLAVQIELFTLKPKFLLSNVLTSRPLFNLAYLERFLNI